MTKVINLFGGPGTGKSSTMAGLFHAMKAKGMSVEIAPEWVKPAVWAGEHHVFDDQLYIFAKQHRTVRRLIGNVDFVVTDAPLLLSLVYGERSKVFDDLVRSVNDQYDNFYVFLERMKAYVPEGRIQNAYEARLLDRTMSNMLEREELPYSRVRADDDAVGRIMGMLT